MNRKLKSQLKTAFDVPAPTRKKEFLQSMTFPKASMFDFVLDQIGYIRKRVWIISVIILMTTLYSLYCYGDENALKVVWGISSILPFVSLVMATEIAKSRAYNMVELEMSCKHSLADIILVRLCILGSFNLIIFILTMLAFVGKTNLGIFQLGVYILTPFLLTCFCSLFVLNKINSRETTYICGGISGFVSLINSILTTQYNKIFEDQYILIWNFIFLGLVFLIGVEVIKLLRKTEELQWNLLLTA